MRNFHSIKVLLERLEYIDKEQAKQIRDVVKHADEDFLISTYDSCEQLDRDCHSNPGLAYLEATALNEILEGHGIECIRPDNEEPQYEYINTGDSYCNTLIRDNSTGRWFVASWGDIVETEGL